MKVGLNPKTCVIRRVEDTETEKEKFRDWNYVITIRRMPKAARAGRGEKRFFPRVIIWNVALMTS